MTNIAVPEDKLAALLDRVLDDETGIIRFLSLSAVQADEPPLFIGIAEMVDTHKLYPRRLSREKWQAKARADSEHTNYGTPPAGTVYSSGAALTRETALWSTVGEACERYAMSLQVEGIDVFAKEDELDVAPIDVSKLILYGEEQYANPEFPFSKYDNNIQHYWTPAVSLVSGNKTYLPTEIVSANYFSKEMPVLDTVYSTGCAAGPNYARALYSGLCEVMERDAFMFYWLTASPPAKLDVQKLKSELSPEMAALIDFPHIDLSLRWLETDCGLPTVACFIRAHNARGFACGASCNANWRLAVEKAIIESFHTLNWVVDLDRWSEKPLTIDTIKDFPHHVQYYLEQENHHGIEFLVRPDAPDATAKFLEKYQHQPTFKQAIDGLSALGYEAVAVDRTYEDLASVDIKVAHVFVPGLQPLHVGVGIEHRDRRRLERIAAYLNIPMQENLNLVPHPFP